MTTPDAPFYVEDDYVYASVADRLLGRRKTCDLNLSLDYFRAIGRSKVFVDTFAREHLQAEREGRQWPHLDAQTAAEAADFFSATPLEKLRAQRERAEAVLDDSPF